MKMFCTNCGKKLEEKAKYCPECGIQLMFEEEKDAMEIINETLAGEIKCPEKMTMNEESTPIIQCEYSNFSGVTKKENRKKKKKKDKKSLLYALLAIGIILVIPHLGSSETEENSDKTVIQNYGDNDFSDRPTTTATNTPAPAAKEVVKVTFEIECESNLIFNTYDLKVLFNEKQIGRLEHGEIDLFTTEIEAGIYTLELRSVESDSVNGAVIVNVENESTFKYIVSCHGSEVEISTLEKINAPIIVADLGTQEYTDVKQSFLDAGFTNVKVNEIKDLSITERDKNRLVSNITVDDISDYTKEDSFFEDAAVVITYRTPQKITMVKNSLDYEGMNYQDVKKELEDLGFVNIEISSQETTDMNYNNGEVYDVNVLSIFNFSIGEEYEYDTTIRVKYYIVNEPTNAPTQTPAPTKAANITVDNNAEFASLMRMENFDDADSLRQFSNMHRGDVIEFEGCIVVVVPHKDYNTRFDVLLIGGDYDANRTVTGPVFWYENVNYYDMNVIGSDTVTQGMNFRVVAKIDNFNEEGCCIMLDPVSMEYRSTYEKAFIRELGSYSLYYLFDTDNQTVVYFGTDDTYVAKGTYSGDFSTGININWDHGEFTEKFIYAGGSKATLIDGNDFEWTYKSCDVSEAEMVLNSIR